MKRTLKLACASLAFAMGGASASAQDIFGVPLAQANQARVDNGGENNRSRIRQQHRGNRGGVIQTGDNNAAAIRQNGDANAAQLVQHGHNNTLTITQNNSNNALCYVQRGNNLDGSVTQNGGENAYIIQNRRGTHTLPGLAGILHCR